MENNLKELLNEQMKIEEMIEKATELMEQLDKIEEESIQKVYDNKAKIDRIINYFEYFNSYDLFKIQKIHNLTWNEANIKKHLEQFFYWLQDFIFQLNLFTNTFIENLINYEMVKKFLDKKYLDYSAREIAYKLENIDTKLKLNLVKEKLFELTWLKNIKWSLTQISNSTMPIKFNYYDFCNTGWKTKVLSDLTKYLFYRQLYFRYKRYSEELWKIDNTENFDIMFFDLFQTYLSKGDILSLKSFISGLYILLHQYSLDIWKSRMILRSMFNTFNIKITIKWEIKIELIDILINEIWWEEQIFVSELKELKLHIKEVLNILYKWKYPEGLEKFKKQYKLNNEEYEKLKDFRFYALYKDGSQVLEKWCKVIPNSALEKKLMKNNYFRILNDYSQKIWMIFNSYWSFNKKEVFKLKKVIEDVIFLDEDEVPRIFKDDLRYMLQIINSIKF